MALQMPNKTSNGPQTLPGARRMTRKPVRIVTSADSSDVKANSCEVLGVSPQRTSGVKRIAARNAK